jgi:hypothetical protein
MTSVTDMFGGGLRPNDPRRFLIEAMVGAMDADNVSDPRELQQIEAQIRGNPLFHGLTKNVPMLIEIATDAIHYAGTAIARAPAIAKGLPARIHRLAAYGMAAAVAAADQQLVKGELDFLEALRIALRISPGEARTIVAAAQAGRLDGYLDERLRRIRALVPAVAEVLALRALAAGTPTDEHRGAIRNMLGALPDLAAPSDELDAALYRAFHRPRAPDAQVFGELERIADTLDDPVDRYWIVVYALVAEAPSAIATWRVIPFLGVMQAAFAITDTDMELAVVDALAFSPTIPRPL